MQRLIPICLLALLVLPAADTTAKVESGDTPTLSVKTIDGEKLRLEEWRGRVVLVDFWASWCEPCRASFPFYRRLAEEYDDELFRILAVSVDEKRSDAEGFVEKFDVPFPVAVDADHELAGRFEPPTMPTCYLIGPDGEVRLVHQGFEESDEATIEKHVERLVAEAKEKRRNDEGDEGDQ